MRHILLVLVSAAALVSAGQKNCADTSSCSYPPFSSSACSPNDKCGFTCNSGYKRGAGACVKDDCAAFWLLQCNYPAHSVPACSKHNTCNFECSSSFVKGYDKWGAPACVCPSGTSKCGGQCKASCPSARSLPEKRDHVYWGKQKQRSCQPGWMACGVLDGGPRAWECVDIQNDLESCGGCPVDYMYTGEQGGVDCTTLPGVRDVACVAGRCAVSQCERGYEVSRSGQHCGKIETVSGINKTASAFDNAVHIVEAAFGLNSH